MIYAFSMMLQASSSGVIGMKELIGGVLLCNFQEINLPFKSSLNERPALELPLSQTRNLKLP